MDHGLTSTGARKKKKTRVQEETTSTPADRGTKTFAWSKKQKTKNVNKGKNNKHAHRGNKKKNGYDIPAESAGPSPKEVNGNNWYQQWFSRETRRRSVGGVNIAFRFNDTGAATFLISSVTASGHGVRRRFKLAGFSYFTLSEGMHINHTDQKDDEGETGSRVYRMYQVDRKITVPRRNFRCST